MKHHEAADETRRGDTNSAVAVVSMPAKVLLRLMQTIQTFGEMSPHRQL
jgi:hypothetical protein